MAMRDKRVVALKILEKKWIEKNDMTTMVQREIDIMKGADSGYVAASFRMVYSTTSSRLDGYHT